jgi:hypothetical protein
MAFDHLQSGQYNKLVIQFLFPVTSKLWASNESEITFSSLVLEKVCGGCQNYYID